MVCSYPVALTEKRYVFVIDAPFTQAVDFHPSKWKPFNGFEDCGGITSNMDRSNGVMVKSGVRASGGFPV